MCQFLSFVVTRDLSVYVDGKMMSHSYAEAGWGLSPSQYAECEWLSNGSESLCVRQHWGRADAWRQDARRKLLVKYPTRAHLLRALVVGRGSGVVRTFKNGYIHSYGRRPSTVFLPETYQAGTDVEFFCRWARATKHRSRRPGFFRHREAPRQPKEHRTKPAGSIEPNLVGLGYLDQKRVGKKARELGDSTVLATARVLTLTQ